MLSSNQNGMVKWLKPCGLASFLTAAVMLLCAAPKATSAEVSSLSALPPVENATTQTQASSSVQRSPWVMAGVAGGVLVCVLATAGIIAYSKTNRRKSFQPTSGTPLASFSGTNAIEAKSVAAQKSVVNGASDKPRSTLFAKNAARANGAHRRKTFDYNRYFTDLMTSVSGYAVDLRSFETNGHRHRSASASENAVRAPATATDESLMRASTNLLSHQKSLIEDQQRLIQEQSRVIEEKSRLIAEKSQLLKLQSELMDSKML